VAGKPLLHLRWALNRHSYHSLYLALHGMYLYRYATRLKAMPLLSLFLIYISNINDRHDANNTRGTHRHGNVPARAALAPFKTNAPCANALPPAFSHIRCARAQRRFFAGVRWDVRSRVAQCHLAPGRWRNQRSEGQTSRWRDIRSGHVRRGGRLSRIY